MEFLECSDVIKIYTTDEYIKVIALKEINLSIKKQTLNALLGPSGSGKSTLMKILGGIEHVSAGIVKVGDYYLSRMSNKELEGYRKKEVGIVNQQPKNNLILSISALNNVLLPMKIKGLPRETRKKKALELLSMVGMTHRIQLSPNKLSGGESQRVSIAVALASDPLLILADEPTGELDSSSAEKIIDIFRELNRQYGKTIIVATHDNRLARNCDTYRIGNGRLVTSALGFSKTYASELHKDELLLIDNYGSLTIPEDLKQKMNLKKFAKINYNKEQGCLEIKKPEITKSESKKN
ncbi:MAG: ABC transporter ATP-binding protein [Candidatus Thorarchaeota archaeon]